jgi:S-adenosylmethionine:tRNA ribosyltransferase-isomerase
LHPCCPNTWKAALYEEHTTVAPQTAARIRELKAASKRCTAVGTTSTRTLESLARGATNTTNLFILPPFEFQLVDQLITNFHLPNSSLMMLVEAFLKFKGSKRHLKDLYTLAIQNDFHFYSFGDSMLIL